MANVFAILVFLHVLGAAVWFGGSVAIALVNGGLRGRMGDVERRELIRHLGRRSAPILWGALALAAASGLLLWRERSFARPDLGWTKVGLAALAVIVSVAHVWLGRRERLRPKVAAMLGMATLLAGLGLLAVGAWLRAV